MKDLLDLKITLMMRFQLKDQAAEQLIQQWLAAHPHHSWSELRELILRDQVIYWHGELVAAQTGANQLQQPSASVKYRGRAYQLSSNERPPQPSQPKYIRRYRGKAY